MATDWQIGDWFTLVDGLLTYEVVGVTPSGAIFARRVLQNGLSQYVSQFAPREFSRLCKVERAQ